MLMVALINRLSKGLRDYERETWKADGSVEQVHYVEQVYTPSAPECMLLIRLDQVGTIFKAAKHASVGGEVTA